MIPKSIGNRHELFLKFTQLLLPTRNISRPSETLIGRNLVPISNTWLLPTPPCNHKMFFPRIQMPSLNNETHCGSQWTQRGFGRSVFEKSSQTKQKYRWVHIFTINEIFNLHPLNVFCLKSVSFLYLVEKYVFESWFR